MNKKFLAGWTVENLKAMNISVPVKENVVANWMKEAGFRYAAYKKTIMWITMKLLMLLRVGMNTSIGASKMSYVNAVGYSSVYNSFTL